MRDLIIDYLNWDSNFFGLTVGKVDLSVITNSKILNKFRKSINKIDYDLVYIYTGINQLPFPNLDKVILEFVDTQLYLKMDMLSEIKLLEYELITEDNIPENVKINDLYKISDEVAPFSRFYHDPKISKNKVVELYRNFIRNSLNGSFGEGLILDYNNKGEVIGLFSLDTIGGVGKEILIGVKESYRGKGSGERLFYKGLNYWKDKGVQEIKTIVSARNIKSLNFHLKLGFSIYKISNIYHLWIKTDSKRSNNVKRV